MTGTVRIGGALVAGIFIILGALGMSGASNTDMLSSVIASTAPERTYIESADSDNDGTKDWEEALQARFVDVVTEETTSEDVASTPYEPPTTLTGKFSEAFFKDYMHGKVNGEDIMSDPSKFIGNAVNAIEQNIEPKRHTRLEFTIVPATQESMHAYANSLVEMLVKDASYTVSELEVFYNALKADDASLMEPLNPIADLYANVIDKSLRMEVPQALASAHLAFINANEANLATIRGMQSGFTDPLLALGHIKHYDERKQALADSLVGFYTVLDAEGVVFDSDEPGSFFYLFEK